MNEPCVYEMPHLYGGARKKFYRADDPAIMRALAIAEVVDKCAGADDKTDAVADNDAEWLRIIAEDAISIGNEPEGQTMWPETKANLVHIATRLEELQVKVDHIATGLQKLQAKVEATRALHQPKHAFVSGFETIAACGTCAYEWPCPTAKALQS